MISWSWKLGPLAENAIKETVPINCLDVTLAKLMTYGAAGCLNITRGGMESQFVKQEMNCKITS